MEEKSTYKIPTMCLRMALREETFRDDRYVYGINGGNGFTVVYLSPDSPSGTH